MSSQRVTIRTSFVSKTRGLCKRWTYYFNARSTSASNLAMSVLMKLSENQISSTIMKDSEYGKLRLALEQFSPLALLHPLYMQLLMVEEMALDGPRGTRLLLQASVLQPYFHHSSYGTDMWATVTKLWLSSLTPKIIKCSGILSLNNDAHGVPEYFKGTLAEGGCLQPNVSF